MVLAFLSLNLCALLVPAPNCDNPLMITIAPFAILLPNHQLCITKRKFYKVNWINFETIYWPFSYCQSINVSNLAENFPHTFILFQISNTFPCAIQLCNRSRFDYCFIIVPGRFDLITAPPLFASVPHNRGRNPRVRRHPQLRGGLGLKLDLGQKHLKEGCSTVVL